MVLVCDVGGGTTDFSLIEVAELQFAYVMQLVERLRTGDCREISASREAMDDLKSILVSRAAFYSKADMRVDTSAQPLAETFQILRTEVREAFRLSVGRARLAWGNQQCNS